jgi:nucleotide-binding universal stress UspA family protein
MTESAHVLVAIDFGAASRRALALGGRLAKGLALPLRVLHAETLEAPVYFTHDQMTQLEADRKAARAAALAHLGAFVGAATDRPAELSLVDGPPTDAILTAAAGAALVVMGTHGRRGPSLWWLGSVAERVVRAAERPVLVVHEAAAAAAAAGVRVLGPRAGQETAWSWAERLGAALDMPVDEAPPAGTCDPARLHGAAIVVVGTGRTGHGTRDIDPAVARILRTCEVPVLFVPGPDR